MADQHAPPLPDRSRRTEAMIQRMLAGKRIAVVGLSDDPSRPSYGVAAYLLWAGKEVLPVNPNCRTVLDVRCYSCLAEISGPIDVVDVFRRPEYCPRIVREAVAVAAKGVWLQSGVISPEAEAIAADAGIDFIQDRCMKVELAFRSES